MENNHVATSQIYQTYLIRCTWVDNRQNWLITYKEINSGQEYHFSTPQQAIDFLQKRLSQKPTLQPFDPAGNPHHTL